MLTHRDTDTLRASEETSRKFLDNMADSEAHMFSAWLGEHLTSRSLCILTARLFVKPLTGDKLWWCLANNWQRVNLSQTEFFICIFMKKAFGCTKQQVAGPHASLLCATEHKEQQIRQLINKRTVNWPSKLRHGGKPSSLPM